jgi:DNA-binding NarL/FixJ family response regulator
VRTPLRSPLTRAEAACALLLANGHNCADIGERLKVSRAAASYHIYNAAKKIPGDLPAQMKVVCWVRGAPLEVLEGTWTNSDMEELVTGGNLVGS